MFQTLFPSNTCLLLEYQSSHILSFLSPHPPPTSPQFFSVISYFLFVCVCDRESRFAQLVSITANAMIIFIALAALLFSCDYTVLLQYISMERRLLKWRRPGNWFERVTGIHPADRNLLFRGIWLRMTRSGLASCLIVGGYYLAVDHLVSE